ncbi:hypothetical protein LINPERHAP2_LOCUS36567, partial [Linum perenne]
RLREYSIDAPYELLHTTPGTYEYPIGAPCEPLHVTPGTWVWEMKLRAPVLCSIARTPLPVCNGYSSSAAGTV